MVPEMTREADKEADFYFQARGLRTPAPNSLNTSMRLALDNMRALLYGPAVEDLTAPEQEVLRGSGLDLDKRRTPDPLMMTAAKFAAILESSLTPAEAAQRLDVSPDRLCQLVADRSLYSVRVEGRRFIPVFQFQDPQATRLVPNIGPVNRALDPELHPVEALNWYTTPNSDLFVATEPEVALSPLNWLKAGRSPDTVAGLAKSV